MDKHDMVSETAPQYKPMTANLPFEEGKHYTYADYITWSEQIDGEFVRYELYEGIPIVMDAPRWQHQAISMDLSAQLHSFLKGKPCKVFTARFDVRFNPDDADDTVLQPDILVICDKSVKDSNRAELDGTGCKGAPDMIIEILSKGSARNDRLGKLHIYEKYGVREYWIIDPDTQSLIVYILVNGKYYLKNYSKTDTVAVHILEGCEIKLSEVFGQGGL